MKKNVISILLWLSLSMMLVCMAGVAVFADDIDHSGCEGDTSAVTYSWDDEFNCTAKMPCLNPEHDGSFIEETVAGEKTVVTEATCTTDGENKYTATFTNPAFTVQETFEKVEGKHDNSKAFDDFWANKNTEIVWSDDNQTCTWRSKCEKCGEFYDVETAEVTEEEDISAKVKVDVTKEPTCTETGEATYTASFWWGWCTTSKKVAVPAKGHGNSKAFDDFWANTNTELVWSDDYQSCTWRSKCETCGEFYNVETAYSTTTDGSNGITYTPVEGSTLNCEKPGKADVKASFWWGWCVASKLNVDVPALAPETGHDWSDWDGNSRKCNVCELVQIKAKPAVSLSKTAYVYNGKVQKPAVTVKVNGKAVDPIEYTVAYPSGCKNVGTYKVKVTLDNNYYGTATASFKINPAATTLKSVKGGKKSFTAKWTKKTVQTTGYQIQYSTNSKFKSAKTKTVTSYKKSSLKVKKLKSKKKYYVRIRTYKTVKGTKFYSGWSKAKRVKVK